MKSSSKKSWRQWPRLHPAAELSHLWIEKARRPRRGYQEVWSEAACPASALRSEGINSAKRSHRLASFLSGVIERFGEPIAPSPPPQRPVILPSGNCDRAARVTTALLQIILSSSTPRSGLRQHVEELLRNEFADIERQAAADRADVNA